MAIEAACLIFGNKNRFVINFICYYISLNKSSTTQFNGKPVLFSDWKRHSITTLTLTGRLFTAPYNL